MPIKVKLNQTQDKYTKDRILKQDPLIPSGPGFYSNIDLEDYNRYVQNPVLTGDLQFDLDSLTETRATNQPWSHRVGNSLVKFVGKSAVNALGSLAAIPAAISAAANKDFSKFADNEIFKGIDDANEWLDKAFPHYLTKAQQDYTTWQKLTRGDSGFWGDSFLGGASFLVGTVMSELALSALGGAAAPLQASLISRAAKQIGKIRKPLAKATNTAIKKGFAESVEAGLQGQATKNMLGRIGRLAMSTITSTGYEASLEARTYKEHALQALTAQFEQQNFRKPNEQELSEMTQAVDKGANSVFALNAVTVGISNALLLDRLIGGPIGKISDDIKLGRVRQSLKKAADGTYSVIPKTKFQKTLDGLMVGISGAGREGLEEGLQSAYDEGLNEYVLSQFNLNALDDTGIISKITNEGLSKAFGTQEGLEEVLVGALLGLAGVPGLVKGSAQEAIQTIRGKDDYTVFLGKLAQDLSNNTDTGMHNNLKTLMQMRASNDRRNLGLSMQDMFEFKNEDARLTYAYMNSRNKAGLLEEDMQNQMDAIDGMSDTEFREKYAVDDSVDVKEAKESIKTVLKDSTENFKKARKLANRYVGTDLLSSESADAVDAISMLAFQTYDLDAREAKIVENIKQLMPEFDLDLNSIANKLKGGRGGLTTALNNVNTKIANTEAKIKEQDVIIQETKLDKNLPDYEQTKAKVERATKEREKLTKQLNEELAAKRNELLDRIKESKDLSEKLTEAAQVGDYENNLEEYLRQVEKAVEQTIKLDQVLKNRSGLEFNKLSLELADLGRMASKRESLLAAYDYMVTPEGQKKFSETNNKFKEALIQKAKYDLIYQAKLEQFINDTQLDKQPNYITALEMLKAELDAKYVLEESQKANNHTLYKLTSEQGETYVSIVTFEDGHIEAYESDAEGNKIDGFESSRVEFEGADYDFVAQTNELFSSQRVNGLNYEALQRLARQIGFDAVFNEDSVQVGDEIYQVNEQLLDVLEKPMTEQAAAKNEEQAIEQELPAYLSNLAGVEFTAIEKVSTENEGLITIQQEMLEQQKTDEFTLLKQMLFNKYSKKQMSETQAAALLTDETQLEKAIGLTSAESNFNTYQSNYFLQLGRKFQSQEAAPAEQPSDVPADIPADVPPVSSQSQTNELLNQQLESIDKSKEAQLNQLSEEEKNETYTVNSDETVEEAIIRQAEEDKAKLNLLGGMQYGESKPAVNPVVPNKKAETVKEPTLEAPQSKSKKALNKFNEVFLGNYLYNELEAASNAVKEANRTGVYNFGFTVEQTPNKVRQNKWDDKINQTEGTVRNGVVYYIHLTLNGVKIGRILDGNRFTTKDGRALDFNNIDDAVLFDESLSNQTDREVLADQQAKINNLTDAAIERGTTENANELLQQLGIRFNLKSYVLLNDSTKQELRELKNKYPNNLSVLNNFPSDTFGVDYNNNKIIPILEKGKLVAYIFEGEVRTDNLPQIEAALSDVISQAKNNRQNEQGTANMLVIRDETGYRTVNVEIPGISVQDLKNKSRDLETVLKNNTLPSEPIVERKNVTLSFVGVKEGTPVSFTAIDKANNPVEITANVVKDRASVFIKYKKIKDKTVAVVQISRDMQLDNGKKLTFQTVESTIEYTDGKFVLTTPNGSMDIGQNVGVQSIVNTINSEINQQYTDRLNTPYQYVTDKTNKLSVTALQGSSIERLGSIGFVDRNASLNDYIPLMVTHDNINIINQSVPNSNKTRPIPNQTFAAFESVIDVTDNATTNQEVVKEEDVKEEDVTEETQTESVEETGQTADDILNFQTLPVDADIAQRLGVDIDTLLKNGTVKYTDETGTECAKAGMASAKFTAGSKWSLVKDLKNMPTHEQGGVNLTFGDGGFMVGTVKAEKGLVIKTDPPSDDTADLQTMKDAFEYTKKYYNSPKFKERYLNAYRKSYGNYNDIRGTDKEQDYLEDIKIEDIQFDNHFRRIQADINNNLKTGQYYLLQGNVEQPMSDRIKRIIKGRPVPSKEGIGSHLSKKRNIVFAYKDQVDHDGEKFGMKQIAPHEFSHQAVNYIESIPPNQAKEIEAMQKGRGGMHIDKVYETKADIDAVRYNMYKSGVYNPMEEDFTIEHLNKYKQTGDKTIKRLEKQYKTRDIIKLMNTVAFNDEDNYLPSYDPFGNTIKAQDGLVITDPPKTTQDSINFMADKIIQYEIARGSAQGTGLPKYKNPYYKDLLVNKIYPEVKKIMPNASAQEAAEAMDFIFNSGFDQTTFKIDKDPRGYALQEYYRKYDKSKLDSDGNWSGRKNPAYSFDDEYNNTIAKLPENERRILMNKGRDWYLQNIERGKGKINENLEAYKNTWYGRIWNTNDFRPFNPNDPRFIYKKK